MKNKIVPALRHWTVSIAGKLLFLLTFCALAPPVAAQPTYPSRQLQIIVPFPPGGSADFFARTVFNKIAPLIGYPIVIENKAGASGIVGAKAVIVHRPTDIRCSFPRLLQ